MNTYYKTIRPFIKKAFYLSYTLILKFMSCLFFWIRLKSIDLENIHKILLIRIDRIGDLVLSTPAIRAVRNRFPHAHISLIVNSYTKEMIENDPYLNEVIVYDMHKGLAGKIRFIRNLRGRAFDLGAALSTREFFLLPAWLLYLSGAKITMGLDDFGRGFLFNIKVKPYPKPRPLAEEILHILSPLGITDSDAQPRLFLSDEDKIYIQEFLRQENIKENDLLAVIHPGGYYEIQRWRKEGYAEVAEHLIRNHGAKIFFIGSQKEKELVAEIIALMEKKPINLAGKISLGRLMALISRCHLFIGNNSGPLNIAIGFDIPTVSFLGPTTPERYSPRGKKHIVIRKDLPCSPCSEKDFTCMREITVEEAIDAVNIQLESKGRSISS